MVPPLRGLETKRDEAGRTYDSGQQGRGQQGRGQQGRGQQVRGPAEGRVARRNQRATAAADGLFSVFGVGVGWPRRC
jgi:hypothetical protein